MVMANNFPKLIILVFILWICQTCQCDDSSKLIGPPLRRLHDDDLAYFKVISNDSRRQFDNNELRHFKINDTASFKVISNDSRRHFHNNDLGTFKLVSNVPDHLEVGQPLTLTVSLQNSEATILNCTWTSPKGKTYEKQEGKLFSV